MIIRKRIFNFEQIRKIDTDSNMIVVDDVSILGEYSTQEKAIKVLDMICADIILECLIFQMPADEDVEV